MSGFENFMEFQHENEGMEISSMSVASPFQLASSDWDPLVSLSQVQNFGGSPMVSYSEFANSSYPLILENQGMSSTSHLVQHIYYNSNLEDMVPKFPSYGSSRFLEMVDVAYTGHEPNYNPSNEVGIENGQINNEHPQGPEEVEPGSAPSENSRERVLDYNFESSLNKDVEVDAMKYSSEKNDTNGVKELDENKQSSGANLHDKQPAKQKKDNSHNGEAHKEGFVRVTAGRGQATNSHSLAERVRREKISERMRFLQELVPGCSKITGKAVMLDEIINYVQSLQQQVEFLSMKLAAVNPELNFEAVEGILSKDIPQSRIGHRHVDGDAPRINCSHPFPGGNFQDTLPAMITTSTQVPPLSPTILDHELQSLYGMSYDSRAAFGNLAPNGQIKNE